MNEFEIAEGGRVKMAGGSIDMYYEAAEAMLDGGSSGAFEAHEGFMQLRDNPPSELKAAFFPSVGPELKQRLRGAGLYRFLRMDQGPGGNFTAFTVDPSGPPQGAYELACPQPHAILEESVKESIRDIPTLGELALAVTTAYASNNLGQTFGLMNEFTEQAHIHGIKMPEGAVGSRSGFFLINPVETNGATLSANTQPAVHEAVMRARAFAQTARQYIRSGTGFREAIALAEQTPQTPEANASDALYFQPDCFVDTAGNVAIERVNFPDVGFFLTEIDRAQNEPLGQVADIVEKLQQRVSSVFEQHIATKHVTIVIKDESFEQSADLLEVNEAKALKKMLHAGGFSVSVIGASSHESLTKETSVIVLNPDVESEAFAGLTENVVRAGIPTFPDPLLKVFEHEASTLQTFYVSGRHLERFLDLVRAKRIGEDNAPQIHEELFRVLERGKVPEEADILYAFVPGQKTPVPLFRYSLHSFAQLSNAIERSRKAGNDVSSIYIRAVPFRRDTAVFSDGKGKRLAAFRPMYVRSAA